MRIALAPLDERPVNTSLPVAVASIAGVEVMLPPGHLLPSKREPGNADGLADWVVRSGSDPQTDAVVVSTDMLSFGGLIASRTSMDTLTAVTQRLDGLRRLRSLRPELPIAAVSLVMRATDSYSPEEEPDYWSDYGRELHTLGALLHRRFAGDPGADQAVEEHQDRIPPDHRHDFMTRRLRNHQVNLEVLSLASTGVLDPLLITADDTAVHAAGSLEQIWLRHWMGVLDGPNTVAMYPGADEVGAILVARALTRRDDAPVRIAIACADSAGLDRVAPYENNPVATTVARQIEAAGAVVSADSDTADLVLVVHAPKPGPGDWVRDPPSDIESEAATATADLVSAELAAGRRVVLADVRYPNGADPVLISELAARGQLLRLTGYAGWNTAGNTIGTVVATGVATVLGGRWGTLDPVAARAFLLHRLIEDYGYQSVARTQLVKELPVRNHRPFIPEDRQESYISAATQRLRDCLSELSPEDTGRFELDEVRLPWKRSFEIDFVIKATR